MKSVRLVLNESQRRQFAPPRPDKATDRGMTAKDRRRFIEAVLWIARTSSPWRDLPSGFGK